MAGNVKREWLPVDCPKCKGTGAALLDPDDPTSGHDLSKTCDACGGKGHTMELRQG